MASNSSSQHEQAGTDTQIRLPSIRAFDNPAFLSGLAAPNLARQALPPFQGLSGPGMPAQTHTHAFVARTPTSPAPNTSRAHVHPNNVPTGQQWPETNQTLDYTYAHHRGAPLQPSFAHPADRAIPCTVTGQAPRNINAHPSARPAIYPGPSAHTVYLPQSLPAPAAPRPSDTAPHDHRVTSFTVSAPPSMEAPPENSDTSIRAATRRAAREVINGQLSDSSIEVGADRDASEVGFDHEEYETPQARKSNTPTSRSTVSAAQSSTQKRNTGDNGTAETQASKRKRVRSQPPQDQSRSSKQPANKKMAAATKETRTKKRKASDARALSEPESTPSDYDDFPQPKRKGRQPGAYNFSKADVAKLLKIVERIKPIGMRGWEKVANLWNTWAEAHHRRVREPKALRTKFHKLVSTTKPTGRAQQPEVIRDAKRINQAIEEAIQMGNIDDLDDVPADWNDDIDADEFGSEGDEPTEVEDIPSASDDDLPARPPKRVRQDPLVGKAKGSAGSERSKQVNSLLQNLQNTLDPRAAESRRTLRDDRRIKRQQDIIKTLQEHDREARLTQSRDHYREQVLALQLEKQRLEMNLQMMSFMTGGTPPMMGMGMGFGGGGMRMGMGMGTGMGMGMGMGGMGMGMGMGGGGLGMDGGWGVGLGSGDMGMGGGGMGVAGGGMGMFEGGGGVGTDDDDLAEFLVGGMHDDDAFPVE